MRNAAVVRLDDAAWVGWRLVELLPLSDRSARRCCRKTIRTRGWTRSWRWCPEAVQRTDYTVAMTQAEAIEIQALKADSFGRIALMRGAAGMFVRRDLRACAAHGCACRRGGWRVARRVRCRRIDGMPATPQLLRWNGRVLDRSYLAGAAMYQRPPRGDVAYFRAARRLLQQLHRRGVAHNDLAKEANWLVLADGTPALIDFQLAVLGHPRSRWMRLLAREDLRHLLKHKRTYCPQALTPVERRLLQAALVAARRVVRDRQAGLPLRDPPAAAVGRQRRAGAEALSNLTMASLTHPKDAP